MLLLILALVIGYLLGALPFGYLVARAKGVNIFEEGSKSPGATNVLRVLSQKFGQAGKRLGYAVFALDASKGAASAIWPFFHVNWTSADGALTSLSVNFSRGDSASTQAAVVGMLAALLGHSFSCFTGFRGGKGVATGTGGFIVLVPLAVLIGALVWAITFYSTRYVSLASIFSALAVAVAAACLREQPLLLGLTILVAVIVVIRHRANIKRLLNGTESKFVKKSPVSTAPKP
jgi:glycerol-3-phosphate acyltransferase PlsY